jgi:hypothetical protein
MRNRVPVLTAFNRLEILMMRQHALAGRQPGIFPSFPPTLQLPLLWAAAISDQLTGRR